MSVKSLIKRIRIINAYFLKVEINAQALDEDQLINDCILPKFPRTWQIEFEIHGRR